MRFYSIFLSALLALAGVFQPDAAKAAVVGTGTFTATITTTGLPPYNMAGTITWNNEDRTVFGESINLGTSVVTMSVSGLLTPGGGSGTYTATADGSPDLTVYGPDGVFLSDGGLDYSFISSATGLTGALVGEGDGLLPPDGVEFAYTSDGFDSCVTAPGTITCTGNLALNAFQAQPINGNSATIPTSFYNPITETEVPITVGVGFPGAPLSGQVQVTATSQAAGTIPSNFAIESGGWRAAFLDITTTASYNNYVIPCVTYPDSSPADGVVDGSGPPIDECNMRLLHRINGAFSDVTMPANFTVPVQGQSVNLCPLPATSICPGAGPRCIDRVNNRICGFTIGLSPFVAAAETSPAQIPALSPRSTLALVAGLALAGAACLGVASRRRRAASS